MQFRDFLENIFGSKVKARLLAHLLSEQTISSERGVARFLGVSHTPVVKALKGFHEANLISPLHVGNVIAWQVNKLSYTFQFLTNFYENIKNRSTPLEDLKAGIKSSLKHVKNIKKALIYGSVAEGTEKPNSDIDLFVLVGDERAKKAASKALEDFAINCISRYGNVLSPTIFTENEAKGFKNKKFLENVFRGIAVELEDGFYEDKGN